MDNLRIYNEGREVPKEAQKQFSNGRFSGTDINPMWRIKKLTELFGPAGIGWYVDDVVERCEQHGDTVISVVTLNLYIKVDGEWSKPIYGTGGNTLLRKGAASDEGYKMAYTDALSVACKALGIGADIWFESDKTKYTAVSKPQPDLDYTQEVTPAQYRQAITDEQIDTILNAVEKYPKLADYIVEHYGSVPKMTKEQADEVLAMVEKKNGSRKA